MRKVSPRLVAIMMASVVSVTSIAPVTAYNHVTVNAAQLQQQAIDWTFTGNGKVDKVYEEAVEDTSGQVLTYNGELKLVPYHQISAGQTRDGETAFHNEEYAYLKAVDSNSDKTAPGYLNSTYIAKQQLPVELRIVEREDSGYVVSLMADENIVEAESFVTGMGIASSDFSMQKTGEQVRFLSKGKGHGLGFSQYGGNKLAKEGKNWKEILNTYFPLMDITKN